MFGDNLNVDPEHWPHGDVRRPPPDKSQQAESINSRNSYTQNNNNNPDISKGQNKDSVSEKNPKIVGDNNDIDTQTNKDDDNNSNTKRKNWEAIWNQIKDTTVVIKNTNNVENKNEDAAQVLAEQSHEIKMAFAYAWHGYAKKAMGHDEIQPVSALPGDSWGGLGATLIDALDTMMLMGLTEELQEARTNLEKIHFDINLPVSFFETTIRHLGGLIGAYEISLTMHNEDTLYLQKAVELANHLLPAFNTIKGIPKSMVNLASGEIKNYGWTRDHSVLAEVGSNQVELFALSYLTSNSTYYEKSRHVYDLLDKMHKPIGLYGRLIVTDKGEFPKNEQTYTIGGMSDSFYEYLLKTWILTDYEYKDGLRMYLDSIDNLNEYLLQLAIDEQKNRQKYLFYGEHALGRWRGRMEELTCFMPGLLALGYYHSLLREEDSKKLQFTLTNDEIRLIQNRDSHLKLAHVLLESCVTLYLEMPTHLAPESIQFDEKGWEVKEPRYQLRPETIESLYIMFSVTSNDQYRKWGWTIFEAIQQHCRTEIAYSGINDVRDIPAVQDNKMESYVMAETFKYLYLLFDDHAASLIPLSEFVFNTEAHPIRKFNLAQAIKQWEEKTKNKTPGN